MNVLALALAVLLDPVLWIGCILAGLPNRYSHAAFLSFGWAIVNEAFLAAIQITYLPGLGSLVRIVIALAITSTVFLIRRRNRLR